MRAEVIERIARQYGFRGAVVQSPQKGYRNESYPITLKAGSPLNLILYKTEPGIVARIRRANRIADHTAATGLPARRTMHPSIVLLSAGTFRKYGALYTYLPGDTIPWEAYTQTHIKLLGAALSTLHARLRDTGAALPAVHDDYAATLRRMQLYFADEGAQSAMHHKLGSTTRPGIFERLEKLLQLTHELPDQQPLHMDFVRSNILFGPADKASALQLNGLAITGILDFEKAAYGSRLFDIARTLAFLLVDCKYKPAEKVRKYFLYSGYHKRGESPLPKHINLLDELINLFLLHDFYKFLRHNPYETLAQNEHYTRTRDMLKKQRLLT